jgi:hypothetical protein
LQAHHNTEIHFISQLNHGWRGGNWPIQEEFNTKKTSKGVTKLLGAQIPREQLLKKIRPTRKKN